MQGLPLDGRNFYDLSLLLPGVVPAAQGSAASVRGIFAINVNGAREDANDFLLDGVYNGDPKLNGTAVSPPVDAIREFEVLASTYDASFGRNGGGQVSVVLRSGGNQFHGTAYEFFRNAVLRCAQLLRALATNPRRRISATSSAARSADPSPRTAPSSSPTIKARATTPGVTAGHQRAYAG